VVKIREYVEAGATVMAPTAGVPTIAGTAEYKILHNNIINKIENIFFIFNPIIWIYIK
jgi:hypothetical protein